MFGLFKKKSKSYTFTDEDRLFSAEKRRYAAELAKRDFEIEMANKDLELAQVEAELQTFNNEDTGNPFEEIILNLIKQKIPFNTPAPVETPEISDAQIDEYIAGLPAQTKKILKNMNDVKLREELLTVAPNLNEDTANRAISRLRQV